MKTIGIAIALLGLLTASGQSLAHDNRGYNNHSHYNNSSINNHRSRNGVRQGIVVDLVPVYYNSRRQVSSRGCSTSSRNHNHTGTIVGAVVGGVIGHEIGHSGSRGGHRNAATAAGVIVGAVVGSQYDHRQTSSTRCVSNTRGTRQLKGYQLTYKYGGRIHTTFVTRKPPNRFRIDELRHYS